MNKRKLTNKEKGILADAFYELDEEEVMETPVKKKETGRSRTPSERECSSGCSSS